MNKTVHLLPIEKKFSPQLFMQHIIIYITQVTYSTFELTLSATSSQRKAP
jgi:hypothetical protein